MKLLLAIVLGAFSAILFNLAFPGGPFPWLAWVALVPVMVLLIHCSPAVSCLGWASYGIFFWFGAIYWLYGYLVFVLELSRPLAIIVLLSCVIISAVPYILVGYMSARWKLFQGALGPFKIAALLSGLVALWPVPFPGDLSMSFYRIPLLTQIADIGGGHLIHFMIIWVNGLILKALLSLKYKRYIPSHIWINLIGIFLLILGYGYFRLRQYDRLYEKISDSDMIKVGYVQPNLAGTDLSPLFGDYLSFDEKTNDFISAIDLSEQLVKKEKGLDLIVWPETPEDIPYHHFDWIREAIDDFMMNAPGASFIFVTMYPWSGLTTKPYMDGHNTIYLVKEGKVSYPYHKVKLIPFSEYLPGENKFPILRKLFPLVGQITPGKTTDYIEVGEKLRIIPLICYDGIFPNFVRKFAIKGGNLFLCLDNDTNFGPTKASEVHFSVMIYRTIENRTPMIRVSNAGPSLTVLSSGKVLTGSEMEMFKKGYRVVGIQPRDSVVTLYQKGGWLFPYFILILLGLVIIMNFLKAMVKSFIERNSWKEKHL